MINSNDMTEKSAVTWKGTGGNVLDENLHLDEQKTTWNFGLPSEKFGSHYSPEKKTKNISQEFEMNDKNKYDKRRNDIHLICCEHKNKEM